MYLSTLRGVSTFLLSVGLFFLQAQTTHIVSNSGLAFTPDEITITVGDTVDWQIGGSHNVVEVSQATYDADGDTPLPGGFSLGFGGGKRAFDSVGTFYYVCDPHAGQGMKGIVTVEEAATGLADGLAELDFSLATLAPGRFRVSLLSAEPGEATLRVLDLSGRRVQQATQPLLNGETTFSVDLTALPRGYYLIELRREGFAPATARVVR